jgi:hypothetical protein
MKHTLSRTRQTQVEAFIAENLGNGSDVNLADQLRQIMDRLRSEIPQNISHLGTARDWIVTLRDRLQMNRDSLRSGWRASPDLVKESCASIFAVYGSQCRMTSSKIMVPIGDIKLEYGDNIYRFNNAKLILVPKSEDPFIEVRFDSDARSDDGSNYRHPHSRGGSRNSLCLGDMTGPVNALARQGDLYGVVEMCQLVVNTYNPRSPCCSIERFPRA